MIDRARFWFVCVRRAPLAAVVAAAGVGNVMVSWRAITAHAMVDVVPFARLSAAIIAAAASSAMLDPAAQLMPSVWRGRRAEATPVLAITGLAGLTAWLPAVVISPLLYESSDPLPIGGLTIELIAMFVIGWVLTGAIAARRGPEGAAMIGGCSLLIGVYASMSVPRTVEWLWRGPDPAWNLIHARWAAIACATGGALFAILSDPAGSRRRGPE